MMSRSERIKDYLLMLRTLLHRRYPRIVLVRTRNLFNGAHSRQDDVFAPGTRHNLHADGQARAAKLYFTRRLLYHITGGGAANLFAGTHAGERNYARRIAEQ